VDINAAFTNGKIDRDKLSLAVNTKERNLLVAKTWQGIAFDKLHCKSTLAFAVDLAHIRGLQEAFRSLGFAAVTIDSSNTAADRNEIISSFRLGKFPILINCGVLTEGTDIPNIDCLVMARPTNSKNLYIQMVGRGLRLHEGEAS
jgi:ATP-dependent helicase IRC3